MAAAAAAASEGATSKAAPADHRVVEAPRALRLRQFEPAWDVQAWLRVAGMSYEIENVRYPRFESTGDLPQVQFGRVLVGGPKIIDWFRSQEGCLNLDARLPEATRARVTALAALVESPLREALRFARYADSERYEGYTRKCLTRSMVPPARWILPQGVRFQQMRMLKDHGWDDEAIVRQRAIAAYRALALELGDQHYFGGDQPCSLDVLLFGHLQASRNEILADWLREACAGVGGGGGAGGGEGGGAGGGAGGGGGGGGGGADGSASPSKKAPKDTVLCRLRKRVLDTFFSVTNARLQEQSTVGENVWEREDEDEEALILAGKKGQKEKKLFGVPEAVFKTGVTLGVVGVVLLALVGMRKSPKA